LHKVIPTGAGLGGGSSDAAFMLRILNELFMLNLQKIALTSLASVLGSDCAFFIENQPSLGSGRGEILRPAVFQNQRMYPVIIKPEINISTAEAFRMIQPVKPAIPIQEAILEPITKWKNTLFNDFEKTIFPKYPSIENIKNRLYELGAIYASMTGSGSAVFGLFSGPAEIKNWFPDCFVWQAETPHW
jgi:4-diphosphocytidyl-2-C-methyl-D-erythritol kinase